MSAYTTKTAVFVLLTLFAGTKILIYVGLFMVFYGIIYAMLQNNIRRILSYSIINQVGFMIVGIGIGTPLALAGVATHAFCHIIYKALLFMSAGSVIHMTGLRKCTDLGGIYRSMKFTAFAGIVGAMAISAFPFTSGFVSKSLISSAAAAEHLPVVWFLLLVASAGVFLHAGIKFPWFVFFHKDSGLRPADPPLNMRLGMGFLVIGCFLPAFFPQQFYSLLLPHAVDYVPYTAGHVITQLQLLMFSGLAFFVMLPMLKRTLTIALDFDWFYRVFFLKILLVLEKAGYFLLEVIEEIWNAIWFKLDKSIRKIHGQGGIAERNWGISITALATTAMLGLLLITYYL
jgi:multicomponent Na+:H+ antiporter subunit D